jgi:flagellar hook-length control protein FliK
MPQSAAAIPVSQPPAGKAAGAARASAAAMPNSTPAIQAPAQAAFPAMLALMLETPENSSGNAGTQALPAAVIVKLPAKTETGTLGKTQHLTAGKKNAPAVAQIAVPVPPTLTAPLPAETTPQSGTAQHHQGQNAVSQAAPVGALPLTVAPAPTTGSVNATAEILIQADAITGVAPAPEADSAPTPHPAGAKAVGDNHRAPPEKTSVDPPAPRQTEAAKNTEAAASAISSALDSAEQWASDKSLLPAQGVAPHAVLQAAQTKPAGTPATPTISTAPAPGPVKSAPATRTTAPAISLPARGVESPPGASTTPDAASAITTAPAGTAPQAATTLHAAPPTTPAAQIAHAVAVHIAPGASGNVTIHLQPAELGAVQVRIERAHDGTATVTVQVEKSETLHSLQQDMPRLHQALDRAGLPSELRQVTLHLAPATGSDTQTSLGNSNDGQRQGANMRQPQRNAATPLPDLSDDEAVPVWRAAGINITA